MKKSYQFSVREQIVWILDRKVGRKKISQNSKLLRFRRYIKPQGWRLYISLNHKLYNLSYPLRHHLLRSHRTDSSKVCILSLQNPKRTHYPPPHQNPCLLHLPHRVKWLDQNIWIRSAHNRNPPTNRLPQHRNQSCLRATSSCNKTGWTVKSFT
jgi:hypothetical protein